MKYKALTSFSGVISMCKNEERELTDDFLIKDLTRAGYIMPMVKIVRGKPATKKKEKIKGGKKHGC